MKQGKIRVLLAKLGLDSHDRGIITVARWLADAGMEIVYLGSAQAPQGVVQAALQENVDVVGLSFSCGQHLFWIPIVVAEMKKQHADNIPLLVGGVIPRTDINILKEMGVNEVFPTDTRLDKVIDYIRCFYSGKMSP